jgi:hypothetical protein
MRCSAFYDPEVSFLPLTGTRVESGGYRGHEGARAYFAEARELWEVLEPEGHDFTDLGECVSSQALPRAGASEWRGEQSALRLGSPPSRGTMVSRMTCATYEEALRVAADDSRRQTRRASSV